MDAQLYRFYTLFSIQYLSMTQPTFLSPALVPSPSAWRVLSHRAARARAGAQRARRAVAARARAPRVRARAAAAPAAAPAAGTTRMGATSLRLRGTCAQGTFVLQLLTCKTIKITLMLLYLLFRTLLQL